LLSTESELYIEITLNVTASGDVAISDLYYTKCKYIFYLLVSISRWRFV